MPQIRTRSTAQNKAEWNLHLIAVFSPPLVEMTDDRRIGGHSNTYLNMEKIMALLCASALSTSSAFIQFLQFLVRMDYFVLLIAALNVLCNWNNL